MSATDILIKPQTVRYWSISDNFTLYRIKPDELVLPSGKVHVRNSQQVAAGIVSFQNNQLVAKVGDKLLPSGLPDDEGNPTLEDEVTFLERQPSYGQYFHRTDTETPDSAPVHEQITALAIAQDLDGLVELAKVEQANWKRTDVGHAVVNALGSLYRATEDEARQQAVDTAYQQVLEAGVEPPKQEE